MIPRENGELAARPCKCVALRGAMAAMRRCGIAPEIFDTCKWDRWEKPEAWQKRAEEMGRKYVRRVLKEQNFSAWFVAAGRPGCGKTKLCSTILREILLGGKRGLYISWRDFARQVKGAASDGERFRALVDPIKIAPILYCDDLLKGRATGPDLNLVFEILNERYAAGRPTIISSELTIDTIIRGDEAVGSRIAERSKGFYLDLSRARNWRLDDHAAC